MAYEIEYRPADEEALFARRIAAWRAKSESERRHAGRHVVPRSVMLDKSNASDPHALNRAWAHWLDGLHIGNRGDK